MSAISLFVPGEFATFQYPARNRFGVPLEYRLRTIKVCRLERVEDYPIDLAEITRRPLVRRGSLIVFGEDRNEQDGIERKFYLEAMRGIDAPPLPFYRLGIYEPEFPEDLIDWVSDGFAPTKTQRLAMLSIMQKCQNELHDTPNLRLAAFPVEE